jgi:hypothetical protein
MCFTLILISGGLIFFTGIAAHAKAKPEIIKHDVHYLNNAVKVNVHWQSANPVVWVRVYVGKEPKEVQIDEYDNRRNPYGYSGELSTVVNIDPPAQEFITYVIQVEDDLRQKSEQVTGKINIAKKEKTEDTWGKEDSSTALPGQQPAQSGTIMDKVVAVIEKIDLAPTVGDIKVNRTGPDKVSFTSRAIDDKGLKQIAFHVLDASGNKVQEQVMSDLTGKIWEGTTSTFTLPPGIFRVVVQVVDSAGNTSKEHSEQFTISVSQATGFLTVTIAPREAVDAGAQWRVDRGDWQNSGGMISGLAAAQHTVEFKDINGWTKPFSQSVAIQTGQTATISGTYMPGK